MADTVDAYRVMSPCLCVPGEDTGEPSPVTPSPVTPFSSDFDHSGDTRARPPAPPETLSSNNPLEAGRTDEIPKQPTGDGIIVPLVEMKKMVEMLDENIHVANAMRAKWQEEINRLEARGDGEVQMLPMMQERMSTQSKHKRGMSLKQAARRNIYEKPGMSPKNQGTNKTRNSSTSKGRIVPCSLNSRCTKDWKHDGECKVGLQNSLTKFCNRCVKRHGHRGRCLINGWEGGDEWAAQACDGFRAEILQSFGTEIERLV